MRDDNPTVYSTEWGRICPKCGNPVEKCICKKTRKVTGDGIVRISRESKGRKGKTVTLIKGIMLEEKELRALLGDLKKRCGSGGAIKEGVLEIQGDHRDVIFEELKKHGFTTKLAGG